MVYEGIEVQIAFLSSLLNQTLEFYVNTRVLYTSQIDEWLEAN